jgi:hypothetical protein
MSLLHVREISQNHVDYCKAMEVKVSRERMAGNGWPGQRRPDWGAGDRISIRVRERIVVRV